MKKYFYILCFLCTLCTSASAHTAPDSIAVDTFGAEKDPFYMQLYLGVNKSANENLPWTEFTRYPWSTGIFFAIGHEFKPLWGWRAALRINRNKSRNVPVCESYDVWGWNSTSLFGDVTFDITDVFRRSRHQTRNAYTEADDQDFDSEAEMHQLDTIRRRPHKFNLKAFVGVGGAYTWSFDKVPLSYTHPYSRASRIAPAFRVGLTATYRVADRWRVGLELSQNMYGDRFNGVAYDTPLDTRTNLKVGVTYLFMKKKKRTIKKPVVRINKLKQCPPLPLIMPDPEDTKLRRIQGHAFLDFPVNETVIYPDYRNNPNELAKIQRSIDSAMFDKSVTITSITLHGYASPESPYSNNTRLAKGRTESMKNYLMRKYHFDSQIFLTEYTPEDWDNLKGFLVNTDGRRVKGDFWYESPNFIEMPEVPGYVLNNRDELLHICNQEMDPDAKNEMLKKVGNGEPYRWLLQYVYPGLRHTDYIIEYRIKAFAVEKGRKLIYAHPEALSLEEMYNVATSYDELSEEWLDALLIAAKQYPDDANANLNAACACVMTKRLTDAKRFLKKAGNTSEARYVSNVVKAMEGTVKWRIENRRVVVDE